MIFDCIKLAFRNLLRHKTRTLLTICGIIIGTCSVTTIFSIGSGGKEQIVDIFETFGVNGLIISSPYSATSAATGSFTFEDIEFVKDTVSEITAVMPVIYANAKVGINKNNIESFVLGIGDNALSIASVSAKYGRGFNFSDINAGSKVCMIDASLAKKMYKRENIVGKKISLTIGKYTESVTVIGVVGGNDSPIGSLIGSYIPSFIYVPYTTFMSMTGENSFESFVVQLSEKSNVGITKEKIISFLEAKNDISGYRGENMTKQQEKIEEIVDILTMIISAIASVSLLVGGLGVMTIMLVAVNERKKGIGLKKAIGATKNNIMAEFLVEAAAISLFGGLLGIILSFGFTFLSAPLLGIKASPNLTISLTALLFCGIIGIIFSVYPAKKAAELDPIECLKYE